MPSGVRLRRTSGWRKPDGAIVVARPGRYGNPLRVGAVVLGQTLTLAEVVAVHADALAWLTAADDPDLTAACAALRGHDLACWCPLDGPCHRDGWLQVANT